MDITKIYEAEQEKERLHALDQGWAMPNSITTIRWNRKDFPIGQLMSMNALRDKVTAMIFLSGGDSNDIFKARQSRDALTG